MPQIVLTQPLPYAPLAALDAHFTVRRREGPPLSESALGEWVKGAEAILCLLTDPLTAKVMDAAGPQLKLIASYNVGYDNIDLAAAAARGITVTNTSGDLSSQAVAEHVLALLMAVTRQLVPADRSVVAGRYHGWNPQAFLGRELVGQTLGIVGTGHIGTKVARMLHQALQMRVLYTDVVRNPALERETGAHHCALEELLKRADVVSLHVPLLPTTQHLISTAQFAMMKPDAILINTARGPVVDEAALVATRKAGQLFGVGLDVFEHEPKIAAALLHDEGVVLTPHTASATRETRQAMAQALADNVKQFFQGKIPANQVSLEKS